MAECVMSENAMRIAGEVFTSRAVALSGQLGAIAQAHGALLSGWTGEAADAYARFQDQWIASADDLSESLRTIGHGLLIMADNVRRTEDAVTAAWST